MKNFSSSHNITNRRLPQRTCVSCRRVRAKRELIRLVRTQEGEVEIDLTGKKEGRGAYLCPDSACWEKGLQGKQLGLTLRVGLTPENRVRLMGNWEKLAKGVA